MIIFHKVADVIGGFIVKTIDQQSAMKVANVRMAI
jgi:hypothetical protein